MKLKFKTKSGSTYELDKDNMTWARLEGTTTDLRSNEGDLKYFPGVYVGMPVLMLGTSLTNANNYRSIITTEVTSVEVIQ